MSIIIDNTDPDRCPDVPAPAGLNKSVPHRSPDTIRYSGGVKSGGPYAYTTIGTNLVAVTFHQSSRDRTWVNVAQYHTKPHTGGSFETQVTEGVSTTAAVMQSWDATLGAEATVDLEVFSATLSASFSQGGSQSFSVELSKAVTETQSFDFKEGVEAEVAAWQLEEAFNEKGWVFLWQTAHGDPAEVTAAMIEDERQVIQKSVENGEQPPLARSFQLPAIIVGTKQFTTSSYPPDVAEGVSVSRGRAS